MAVHGEQKVTKGTHGNRIMTYAVLLLTILMSSLMTAQPAKEPIRVMLLDGQSGGTYHDWRHTTPVLKKELEDTGMFQVDVVTAPPSTGDFKGFAPRFEFYKAIVMNYDGPGWPPLLQQSFEEFVANGGGLVIVHAADNAFADWPQYNRMIGLGGWRDRNEK